jgi:outer membrane protein TolC
MHKTVEEVQRAKNSILSSVHVTAGVQEGSFGNVSLNQVNVGYSLGLNIAFGLADLVNYKKNVNIANENKTEAGYKEIGMIQDLRLSLLTLAADINTLKTQIKFKSQAYYYSYAQFQMANQEYKKGLITLADLSRITETYTNTQLSLETAKDLLRKDFAQLETLTGKTFVY